MTQHPTAMPDEVARKLADLAREHGYGIEHLTLSWVTKDLGQPLVARTTYAPDAVHVHDWDGSIPIEAL